MNIDDTQWATWEGVIHTTMKIKNISKVNWVIQREMMCQIKNTDPRVWLRSGQVSLVDRVKQHLLI